jgi:hypothetical protein
VDFGAWAKAATVKSVAATAWRSNLKSFPAGYAETSIGGAASRSDTLLAEWRQEVLLTARRQEWVWQTRAEGT